jgi:hypothetical protein
VNLSDKVGNFRLDFNSIDKKITIYFPYGRSSFRQGGQHVVKPALGGLSRHFPIKIDRKFGGN